MEHIKYGVVEIVEDILSIKTCNKTFTQDNNNTINNTITDSICIRKEYLYNLNLNDEFFNTLRQDYFEFDKWFSKKQLEERVAYITVTSQNKLSSFLMLKEENEQENYSDFEIPLLPAKRLKISTFKVSDTGKKIGEYFIKIIFDEAINSGIREIYVTTFENQKSLIYLLKKYGFKFFCYRDTKKGNGSIEKEAVYIKNLLN